METDFVKRSYKISVKENLSLNVYNTGYQRCEAGYTWGPGTRDHYLFHYVTQGKGTLSTPEGGIRGAFSHPPRGVDRLYRRSGGSVGLLLGGV